MDFFTYFENFYDKLNESIAIVNHDAEVVYCNEAFCSLVGISSVRFRNKKISIEKCLLSVSDSHFNIESIKDLVRTGGNSISQFQTKNIQRGIGKISCSLIGLNKFDESTENLGEYYLITLYDLTYENEIIEKNKFETKSRDNLISEMNDLIEILQKIRLVNSLEESINIFTKYLVPSDIMFAANMIGSQFKFITDTSSKSQTEIKALNLEIQKFLASNKITRYTNIKLTLDSLDQTYYVVLVPFEFTNSKAFSIFAFSDPDHHRDFKHQSAISLSEQLSVILNNLVLKETVITDSLTQLKNSMFFRNRLNELCQKSERIQLVLFDVDFFKKVNDTYGHLGGDAVLIQIGATLKAIQAKYNFRLSADQRNLITSARIGGEEFAILIPEQPPELAYEFAEDLRINIEQTVVKYQSSDIKFTISLGLSSWSKADGSSEQVIKNFYKNADDALYASKKSGRNKISSSAA
jgi:diguanylate cyclase (GGDEF)-like protein